MLEASDVRCMDNITKILGELVDSPCGLTKSGKATSASAEYVDMVNYSFKRHKSLEWCIGLIKHLQIRL